MTSKRYENTSFHFEAFTSLDWNYVLHRTGEGHLFLPYRRLQQKILLGRGWKGGTRYDRSYCGLELKAVWAKPLTHLSTHLSSTHNKTNGSLLCKSSLFVQRSSATLNWASYLLKLVPCDVVLVWWTSNKQAWFAFILKFLICSGWNETVRQEERNTLKMSLNWFQSKVWEEKQF